MPPRGKYAQNRETAIFAVPPLHTLPPLLPILSKKKRFFTKEKKEKIREKAVHYEKHEKAWDAQNSGFSFFVGKGDVYGFQNNHCAVPGSVSSCKTGIFVCPQLKKVKED
jgi:hypothetical protein